MAARKYPTRSLIHGRVAVEVTCERARLTAPVAPMKKDAWYRSACPCDKLRRGGRSGSRCLLLAGEREWRTLTGLW